MYFEQGITGLPRWPTLKNPYHDENLEEGGWPKNIGSPERNISSLASRNDGNSWKNNEPTKTFEINKIGDGLEMKNEKKQH